MAYKRLRHNELHRAIKKFGKNASKPTLDDHLKHLIKRKLIKRKVEKDRAVSYGLTEEIVNLRHVSPDDIAKWLENFERNENLPEKFSLLKIDKGEFLEKMTDGQLDQLTDKALRDTLSLNLFELKTMIGYELKIDKNESDADFWRFIGNPMYRMYEKSVAEDCRDSERYRKSLFEKIDILINELRSDKELIKQRNERANQTGA